MKTTTRRQALLAALAAPVAVTASDGTAMTIATPETKRQKIERIAGELEAAVRDEFPELAEWNTIVGATPEVPFLVTTYAPKGT